MVLIQEIPEGTGFRFFQDLEKIPSCSILVFTEPSILQANSNYITENFWDNCLIKTVRKEPLEVKTLCNLEDEHLLFYCSNETILTQLAEFSFEEVFHYAELKISIEELNHTQVQICRKNWKEKILHQEITQEKDLYTSLLLAKNLPDIFVNKKIILWGSGHWGEIFVELFSSYSESLYAFCDNNEKKWGTEVYGLPVISVHTLLQMNKNEFVVVISCVGEAEVAVSNQLLQMEITTFLTKDECLQSLKIY